jgi:hypothetical protein
MRLSNRGFWTVIGACTLSLAATRHQAAQRYFWPVSLDSLAIGHKLHTHVAVTGTVVYTRREDDGDCHIKVVSPSGAFIIAECIPALPCPFPRVGARITVYGISRRDPEHGWWEVHPVERWEYAPALLMPRR